MIIELADCERLLLEEIGRPELKRADIAQTYALTLKSSERERVNWAKVNLAIITRWSKSGLHWIKQQAWSGKCFHYPHPPSRTRE